jgi:superfamily II DNA or RNA helicase
MHLLSHLTPYVEPAVQQRGQRYADQHRVSVRHASDTELVAEVYGSIRYTTALRISRGHLMVACTCPYYEDRATPCKHLWATALAADEARALGAARGERTLRLQPEPSPDDVVDGGAELPANRNGDRPPPSRWRHELEKLAEDLTFAEQQRAQDAVRERQLIYVLDGDVTLEGRGLAVEVLSRDRKADGGWGAPRARRISAAQVASLRDPADQQIMATLLGATAGTTPFYGSESQTRFRLFHPLDRTLLPAMCRSGRCRLRSLAHDEALTPLGWDEGEPWQLQVEVTRSEEDRAFEVRGHLRRGGDRLPLDEPRLMVSGGLVVARGLVARLEDNGLFPWITQLLDTPVIRVPLEAGEELLDRLFSLPRLPRIALPPDLALEEVRVAPRPRLRLRFDPAASRTGSRVQADLLFDYDGVEVSSLEARSGLRVAGARRLVIRDDGAEQAACLALEAQGARATRTRSARDGQYELAASAVPAMVRRLLDEGWQVEAAGRRYRQGGRPRYEVRSGIDWFDLFARVEFEGETAPLPQILSALRRGERTVVLGDGSLGMLPEEWVTGLDLLMAAGTVGDEHVRFTRNQVAVLDALLAATPQVTTDEAFERLRRDLATFAGVTPLDPPPTFTGRLREYQREALGWLAFLERYGFGGCLADDMGLGKTVVVLAHLAGRPEGAGPTLVVVPRSLAFNWRHEAARFTPWLRVVEHIGSARGAAGETFGDRDVILTTYGTLRRDIVSLRHVAFDLVVLDEAQAVKNAGTAAAKAVRLLNARHRLALSGTPVENHLGELWSLFEFLNPGMLGRASLWHAGAKSGALDEESRTTLARALRPFILRRTKAQVARELPARVEQTIFCELEGPQRALYDELRAHYRQTLLSRVDRMGMGRSRMQVLEALLRLRQAACHPGLIEAARARAGSAKLDALVPLLAEVTEEGHKALVFSQFTSLLAILRTELDELGLRYTYLDGQTRDREARVREFQEDPECRLFLISLRAGGVGLNLTAAEYVFLLDPWWNPAVEAQAIDRTHRIGQSRQVFAYRLIARDTVEEKVLELQQTKRDLAEAIITADNARPLAALDRGELERLLS